MTNHHYTPNNLLVRKNRQQIQYDPAGNQTAKGKQQLSYDAYGRLQQISKGILARYQYKTFGQSSRSDPKHCNVRQKDLAMLMGRLEVVPFLILFVPEYWR